MLKLNLKEDKMEKPETYLTLSSEYTRQHFMELDRHGNLSILLLFFGS